VASGTSFKESATWAIGPEANRRLAMNAVQVTVVISQ
jgi:hypothetical protein